MAILERAFGIYSLNTGEPSSEAIFNVVAITDDRMILELDGERFEGTGFFEVDGEIPSQISTIGWGDFLSDASYVESFRGDFSETIYEPAKLVSELSGPQTYDNLARQYSGDDYLIGSSDPSVQYGDLLFGYGGNDRLLSYGAGSEIDFLDGGFGTDTAIYQGAIGHYEVEKTTNFTLPSSDQLFRAEGFLVTDIVGIEGQDFVTNVERLQFADKNLALDFQPGQNAYKAAKLIAVSFGEDKIEELLGAALNFLDNGSSVSQICELILRYGLNPELSTVNNAEYVSYLYENVTGLSPNTFQILPYLQPLDDESMTRSELLTIAAESSLVETQLELQLWRSSGMEYLPTL